MRIKALLLFAMLSVGSGGIDLALPSKEISPEVLELRGQVYSYASALLNYDANAKAQYVLQEARFRQHMEVSNLNAENAALLDKIREAVRRELQKTREYLENGGDRAEAQKGIEETIASYLKYEQMLINNGSMVVMSSKVVKK